MNTFRCHYCGASGNSGYHQYGDKYICPKCYTYIMEETDKAGWADYWNWHQKEPDVDFSLEGNSKEIIGYSHNTNKSVSEGKEKTVFQNEITENILDFILAGKAEFIVYQEPSGNSKGGKENYKVVLSDSQKEGMFFVYRNNTYLGYFFVNDLPKITSVRNKTKKVENMETLSKPLCYVLRLLSNNKELSPLVHVIHIGKCSVCGKKLSDPVSIQRGIGPECYKRIKYKREVRGF